MGTGRALAYAGLALTGVVAAATGGISGAVEPLRAHPAAGRPQAQQPPSPGSLASDAIPIEPLRIDAELRAREQLRWLRVDADLTFRTWEPLEELHFFLQPNLQLELVSTESGAPLPFRRDLGDVYVRSPPLRAGEQATWRFSYTIPLQRPLGEVDAFYSTSPWYPYLRFPAGEDEFLRYIPVRATVTASVPSPWAFVSAGSLSLESDNDLRRFRWTVAQPATMIPLVMGRLTQTSERLGDLEVSGFFVPETVPFANSYLEYVADAVRFYSNALGPYPSRHYTLAELALPARIRGITMPGLTVMSSHDLSAFSPFPYVILAHEVAHNWWSHSVEFPSRSDAWLREGLPTYAALLFVEERYGAPLMREELERTRQIALAVERPQALSRGLNMEQLEAVYSLNYHKAAFVLHMLRTQIGLQRFNELMARFYRTYRGRLASTSDFNQMAAELYGEDLGWFFSAWLDRSEIPSFRIRYSVSRQSTERFSPWELAGTVEQLDAEVRAPVVLKIPLDGAPPLEHTLWLEPGTTEFGLVLPSRPGEPEFDPFGDLLYQHVDIQRVSASR